MRLLVVSDYAWRTGGVEQFVDAFLGYASRLADCRLLTWDDPVRVPEGFDAVTSVVNGDVRGAWSCLHWADVVMVVTSFNVRLLARLAEEHLRTCHTPAVTVVQTSGHSYPGSSSTNIQEQWLRGLMEASYSTVAVSEAVRSTLERLFGPSRPTPPIVVIENAARLRATAARRGDRRVRVSFVGRPSEQKGFPLFIRLARELRGTKMDFAANTVSVEPAEHSEGVVYSHLLDDDEMLAFFSETDLLVAPYLHADGLPLALLEAINCGVTVLGFDSPAVAPLLRRHRQAVIPPTYAALRDTVMAWHRGDLTIAAPAPGQVASWDNQFVRYVDLLRAAERTGRRGTRERR